MPDTFSVFTAGWHLPSDAEWTELGYYLIANGYNQDSTTSNDKTAKSLAAKSGWDSSSEKGDIGNDMASNNKTGFSALPGGYRYSHGSFNDLGGDGYWWSSSSSGSEGALNRNLWYGTEYLRLHGYYRSYGFSVRCLQD